MSWNGEEKESSREADIWSHSLGHLHKPMLWVPLVHAQDTCHLPASRGQAEVSWRMSWGGKSGGVLAGSWGAVQKQI